MKRFLSIFLSILLFCSPVLADSSHVVTLPGFAYTSNWNNFAQVYTGTIRTRTNSAGLLETVVANTPVIDHVGTSLTPALRMEPAAANILLEVVTDWTKSAGTTVTKNAASWAGTANGAWTIVAGGDNATVVSTAISASSAAFTFVVAMKRSVGTGAVYMSIDNGSTWTEKTLTTSYQYFNVTKSAANPQLGFKLAASGDEIIVDCLMLNPNTAIASSYFAPAAAIGDELVTNGSFAAVTEGAELATGLLTIGNCYKITARTDGDFIAAGSPDNNVGTYWNATTTGVGLLDAGDKVVPITATNWTAGVAWAPQATAGALTGKMQKIAGAAAYLTAIGTTIAANKVYRFTHDVVLSAGYGSQWVGGTVGATYVASRTPVNYIISADTTAPKIYADATFVGTVDNVSVKEAGSVRISEANTITLATPAAVSAALAATGTLVVNWMPSYARAAGVVTDILTSKAATNSLLYTTTAAGNLSSNDETTVAASTAAYAANTWTKLATQWPSTANKYKIGADVNAGGIAYGAEAAFDGTYPDDGTLRVGRVLYAPMWIQWIRIYPFILSDNLVNELR